MSNDRFRSKIFPSFRRDGELIYFSLSVKTFLKVFSLPSHLGDKKSQCRIFHCHFSATELLLRRAQFTRASESVKNIFVFLRLFFPSQPALLSKERHHFTRGHLIVKSFFPTGHPTVLKHLISLTFLHES